jgi:hypothetical protein
MEEDLIASYFHMVGRGELKKYKWIRLNDNTVYDALAYSPDLPESDEAEEKMLTVEFKFSLEELCKSDEERKQRFEDIHLAIVWKVGDNENLPADYELLPKEADTGFMEYLPDVNYRVKHVRRSVQIICLEDIYNEILEREKK